MLARATGGALTVVLLATTVVGTAAGADGNRNVKVVDLRVNGRYDEPLGLDDSSPVLAWRMKAAPWSAWHRCLVRARRCRALPTGRPRTRFRSRTVFVTSTAATPLGLRQGHERRPVRCAVRRGRARLA